LSEGPRACSRRHSQTAYRRAAGLQPHHGLRLLALETPPRYERKAAGSLLDHFKDAVAALLDEDPAAPATGCAFRSPWTPIPLASRSPVPALAITHRSEATRVVLPVPSDRLQVNFRVRGGACLRIEPPFISILAA
jgi:hypothetical protein